MTHSDETEERDVLCSRCMAVVPESHIHVIPHFDQDMRDYATTYRCGHCWESALEETRARIESTRDQGEIALAAAFFERHGIVIPEFRRGDRSPIVRMILLRLVGMLASGALQLAIGTAAS